MSECVQLTIIVAAYNEADVIENTVRRIVAEVSTRPDVTWELICVDDGSTDQTGAILNRLALENKNMRVMHHRRNFGQGRALRTAFDICLGDFIVTLDADLSYGPQYIYQMVDALQEKNVEIALASPYTSGGKVRNIPLYRHFLSRVGNAYLKRMSSYPIATSTCVVRAYRREVIDEMTFTSDGMELQLEILMKASRMRYGVVEIPATLEWAVEKLAEAKSRRVSKMRIMRTIQLYLQLGWLQRPAYFLILISLFLILPGLYMAFAITMRYILLFSVYLPNGLLLAISDSLRELVMTYPQSIVFAGVFLIFGMQLLAFALILLQNKLYFDELCRLQELSLNQRHRELMLLFHQKEGDRN